MKHDSKMTVGLDLSDRYTQVCVMDADNRYCLGCRRTLDEIARWGGMDDDERGRVLAALPARQEARPCAR